MNHVIKLLRNPHFWIILVIFLICVVFHYPQQIPFLRELGLSSLLGLSRHAVERILFLLPIVYAGLVFGLSGGIVCLVAALAAMLPRVILISSYPGDASFETGAVIAAGGLVNWWLESRRRESGRREQTMLQLEVKRRELQSHIQSIKENERRLSALHSISTVINQSLVLQEVLDTAGDRIKEVIDIDAILIFILDEETGRLELKVHRGVSEEFASKITGLKIGEGLIGRVAQTGEPCLVKDSTSDPRLSPEVVKQEGIKSQFILPLKSSDKVIGTLCAATREVRQFTAPEEELLVLVSIQLGVAIEKAYFCQELQRVGSRFQEIFEKAYDAIWIQDFQGVITNANQAAARLTGYELKDLIGKDVSQFLAPEGLELARQVGQKLLRGEEIKQPYEQRIVRKDGTQAILMLTTSLLEDESMPLAFQHIARDITEETKLQENLRLYATQISQAHEEERKRIARELHDDTIQTIIAVSRYLDDVTSRDSTTLEEILRSLAQLRGDIDETLIRTRRFIQDLRPPTLEYLGLIAALRELATQVQEQSGIEVNLKVEGLERRFTSEEELLIYRIAQETLRNIWRHSEATKAEFIIEFNEEKTVVVISDNGRGFEVGESSEFLKAGKLGLMGMKERAHLLGGTLDMRSKPGNGTTVILGIPNKSLVM